MSALLLTAAIAVSWPPSCLRMGDFYAFAAMVRDSGLPLEVVTKQTKDRRIRRALVNVYEEPGMTPEQWRWFIVGACVGTEPGSKLKAPTRLRL